MEGISRCKDGIDQDHHPLKIQKEKSPHSRPNEGWHEETFKIEKQYVGELDLYDLETGKLKILNLLAEATGKEDGGRNAVGSKLVCLVEPDVEAEAEVDLRNLKKRGLEFRRILKSLVEK